MSLIQLFQKNIKYLTNMQMSLSDILETLKFSVNFEEFQVNYNELIPDIANARNNSLNDWKIFIKDKNEMKKRFYEKYCNDYPIEVIRKLREAKYIYDININNQLHEIEKIINPIISFKNRLKQLQ